MIYFYTFTVKKMKNLLKKVTLTKKIKYKHKLSTMMIKNLKYQVVQEIKSFKAESYLVFLNKNYLMAKRI